MKILLVDDETVALRALKKRVDWVKYGFTEVYEATGGEEAKEIMAKEGINLLLCDIEMPGENGLDLIEYAKREYPAMRSVMVTCHAEFSYVQQAMRCGARDYILKPIDYDELGDLLTRIGQELKDERDRMGIDSLVQRVLSEKEEDPENGLDSNEARLRYIKAYIDEHIHEKLTMKTLAEQVHMNEQHMVRIFKKETGQSILDYITERRIAIAGRMLKETDYSINFISTCVGCENYSYFTKVFKKQTGYTPSEYRGQFKK